MNALRIALQVALVLTSLLLVPLVLLHKGKGGGLSDMFGGGITSMRSQMRVNCKEMTAAGVEVILFEDEAKNRAFARNKAAKIEYLKEPAGSSADLVIRFVCGK